LPQGVPAAVVGPAKRGPAFVPKTFATIQQFEETFGSLRQVDRESNANRFGPLALNEWMRNAQAGTFLRVLGVGSGTGQKDSSGRVAGAGFVVGDKVSHDASNDLQNNPHAAIANTDVVGATKAGRTHFLGCFMKDEAGSTFLQDAGIQTGGAAATLVIELGAQPIVGDTIKLDGVDTTGDLNGDVTFTFGGEGGQSAIGANVVATLQNLKNKIEADAQLGNAGAHQIKVTAVEDVNSNNALARVTLESAFPNVLNKTNDCVAKFNINPAGEGNDLLVKVGDKTASVTGATFNYGQEGGSGAKCVITITDVPANNSSLELKSLDNDNLGGLTSATVVYAFKSASVTDADQTSGETGRYSSNETNSVFVDASGTKEQALANLKAALDRAVSNHTGKYTTSISDDGLSLTVIQKQKGKAGRADHSGSANVSLTNQVSNLQISVGSDATDRTSGDATAEFGTGRTSGFFFGGDNAGSTSFTMTLTGQPNDNDHIKIRALDNNHSSLTNENFVFESVTNASGRVNGQKTGNPGAALAFNGSDPNNHFITVIIGDDLQETLYNFKNALKHSNTVNTKTDVTALVDDNSNSIKITLNFGNGKLQSVLKNVVDIADTATFTNPAGDTLTGNFGPKTVNFTGGGGAAAPVVRGILMSPQGVVPTIDVTDDTFNGTDGGGFAELTHLRVTAASGANIKSFGSTQGTHLMGYELGKVDISSDQSFTLLLNGFSNTDEPAQLSCSFNPESVNYFAKVLNTDPEKIEERGHYLYSHWDIDPAVAKVNVSGVLSAAGTTTTEENAAFCLHSTGARATEAANSPAFEKFDTRFRTARSPWITSQKSLDQKLFRLYSLDDGAVGNDRFRILISNIRAGATLEDYGFFDLTLEDFYSDPVSGEALVAWKNLTLDPDSRNFIGRVIGDKHMYYDFDRDLSRQRLVEEGMFEVRNKYVRVELSDAVKSADVPKSTLPCGFSDYTALNLRAKTGLFDESGTVQLAGTTFDSMHVTPLPLVKNITRSISSTVKEASDALAWGVKFAKKKSAADHNELGEIRFNPSIKSWTSYIPDLGSDAGGKFALSSTEKFSLENIVLTSVSNYSALDWSTSEYARKGSLGGKSNIVLSEAAKVGRNVRYLKFRCLMQGGFDGVNIFNKDKAAMNSAAAFREANEESTGLFTGPTVETFKRAIDVLSDKSATEFQLLAIPDMREPLVTDYAITACESRFDAMLVMDIQEIEEGNEVILDSAIKPHVGNIITKFDARNLDTSFAAAYFPDVLTRRPSNGSPLQVPPSVCMLGVMSQNDTLADPWFAPAGLTRGRLNAVNSKVQMNRDVLNDLYDADINPIYEPAGRAGEVYAFGQKTLLQNQSALDRVNVRRLLINIRRRVKAIANTLLFEPNRASTLARFSSLVEPIMADVQARQGVERYKVQIDTSTTTQNDVENNTIRGKIYLQPTKSVEFISLDFVVTNSID